MWVQKVAPKLDTQGYAGYCLGFVTDAYFTPGIGGYDCARAAWDNSSAKHADRNFPDVAVPVWYSWKGTIGGVYKDWGHVAIRTPDGRVLSCPGSGYGQQWFNDVDHQGNAWGLTYLGWTHDLTPIDDVAYWVADPTPAPTPTPEPSPEPSETYYTVVPGDNLWNIAVNFYGDGTRYPEIAAANGIENPNLIFPGQVFIIPGV